MNLDGKVNWEAIRNRRDISAYLIKNKINWVCDWIPKSFNRKGWELVEEINDPSVDPFVPLQLYRLKVNPLAQDSGRQVSLEQSQ